MLDAVRLRPTQLNATAHRRSSPARLVAIRRLPCGARRAVSGSAEPYTPAGTSGKTRNPAGTWAAACPWRRRLARGCLHPVPSDGAANGRRATAGLQIGNLPTWVACCVQRHGPLSGAPRRLLAASSRTRGRCQSPLPACSRQRSWRCGPATQARRCPAATPCHLRRDSVVSTSEAGTDDAGNATSCKVAVPVCRDNGGTTGFAGRLLRGRLWGLDSPHQGNARSRLKPSRGASRRGEALPVRKNLTMLTALSTPADSHPQVRAINTYQSGRCEHA